MTVADRIGVMDRGRLAQVGTPAEVYEQPASRWVAGFIGDVNLLEGRVSALYPGLVMIERGNMRLRVDQEIAVAPGETVCVALRPEKITLEHEVPANNADNGVAGVVADVGYRRHALALQGHGSTTGLT